MALPKVGRDAFDGILGSQSAIQVEAHLTVPVNRPEGMISIRAKNQFTCKTRTETTSPVHTAVIGTERIQVP